MRLVETFWGKTFEDEGESPDTFSPKHVQSFESWMKALEIAAEGRGEFNGQRVDIVKAPQGFIEGPASLSQRISNASIVSKLKAGQKIEKAEMKEFLNRLQELGKTFKDGELDNAWKEEIKSINSEQGEEAAKAAANYRQLFHFALFDWPRHVSIHELVKD